MAHHNSNFEYLTLVGRCNFEQGYVRVFNLDRGLKQFRNYFLFLVIGSIVIIIL